MLLGEAIRSYVSCRQLGWRLSARCMGVTLWPEADMALVPAATFDPLSASGAHTEYRSDPVGWAVEKLGVPEATLRWSLGDGYDAHVWDGTREPLETAFLAIRDWQDAAIESGTGTGKSYGVAILILWFLACFEGAEVYTFAPTEDQLKLYIWKNIGDLWSRFSPHFPAAELTSLTIRMRGGIDETWSAHGRAVQIRAGEAVSNRAAGMHAEHMLLVYEETPGIDSSVLAAGKHTCTAPHNLRIAIGNPNHRLDALHLMTQEAGVVAIRMSALDHPNVVTGNANLIPGAISQVSIDKRRIDFGEVSPSYQSRVRGISPEQASDALIRLEWLKAARLRYEARKADGTLPTQVTGKGVDVANSANGDHGAIVDFAENVCIRIDSFPCPDSNALGAQIVREARNAGLPALRIGVDAIGVGAGTVNEARRLGWTVNALYAGGNPMKMVEKTPDGQAVEWSGDVNLFKNLRSQMYWQARTDLQSGGIDVPYDKQLWEDLVAPSFDDSDKVVKVESKDDIKERLGRSPDKADAFVMANWVRKRHVVKEKEIGQPKTPHRAYPLTVKDGKMVPPKRAPSSAVELAEWAAGRAKQSRLPHQERLPRRTYK